MSVVLQFGSHFESILGNRFRVRFCVLAEQSLSQQHKCRATIRCIRRLPAHRDARSCAKARQTLTHEMHVSLHDHCSSCMQLQFLSCNTYLLRLCFRPQRAVTFVAPPHCDWTVTTLTLKPWCQSQPTKHNSSKQAAA